MTLRILSIDGGGTRGVIPATILDCIYQDFGKTPLDLFDLFAGTSTGGIICIGLAAGLKPSELVDLYLNKSDDIFYESFLDNMQGMDEYVKANYQNDRFEKILTELFGNKTLGDLDADPNFGGAGKNLMVCTFDLHPDEPTDRNKNYRPKIFHSSFTACQTVTLKDLAQMTSAGPTYFPIYKQQFIDGGVALNNPSMAAISFAINSADAIDEDAGKYMRNHKKGLCQKLEELHLFSLSTGTGNQNRIEKAKIKTGDWGNMQWINYLPDMLTETNMQSTIYYVKQLLNKDQYKRIELFFDDPKAPDILKTRPVGLDAKEKPVLKAMHQFAKDTYQSEKANIAKFLSLQSINSGE